MSKGGLRKKYLKLMLIALISLIAIWAGTYTYTHDKWGKLTQDRQVAYEKAQAMDELSQSVSNLFFRARGYYAFKIANELDSAYIEMENVTNATQKLRSLDLNEEEQKLIDEIDIFINQYKELNLPYAVSLVRKDDYKGLRELSLSGSNATVNRFIEYADQYNKRVNAGLLGMFEKATQQMNIFYFIMLLIGSFFMIVVILIVQRIINDLIRPIEQMKTAADKYQNGRDFTFKPISRTDEMGALSESFAGMINTIHTKEQELMAQNEELLSQQDELIDKQAKMEYALSEARYSKLRLERFNGLNHQLSFSLNKQEIADTVLDYFNKLYSIDLGGFWLPQSGVHALKGISEKKFTDFQENQLDYIKLRLEEEPYFILKREANYEKGISIDKTFVYDFFAGVKDGNDRFGIAIALSRIGRPFSKEDMIDIYGLLKRASLAVDRIEQYEIINHERTLNQNILDNVNEGIRFVSSSGTTDKYNRSLFRLLNLPSDEKDSGMSRDQWTKHFLNKIEDKGELKMFIETSLTSTDDIVSQTSYTIPGDSPKVMNVYSVPVMIEGDKAGTIFVHRDITKEHEIDRLKTELVSTVSHELRTPLSSVLGFTELLLSKEMDPVRQKRYLETIHKEAKRLTNLINDFLDLQRMESGKQSYNMIDHNLSEIAMEVVSNFPVQGPHSITIEDRTIYPTTKADRDKIIQVFMNLLSNAIKFSPDGGNILILLYCEDDRFVVSITDEGIGIPADKVSHMFEKFQRFDNSYSRKIGGTGLGLAICREIIEQHGGQVWIKSEENVGTTVSFSLPVKTMVKTELLSSDSPSVIIVEDDSSIALLLAEELKMKGFSVIHQSNVKTAFDYAREKQPDCIVVDLLLGEQLTGWDLIRLLREEKTTQHIPVIISSALEEQENLVTEFNVERYMTKPYPLHELSETVSAALNIQDGTILYPEAALKDE